VIVSPAFAGKRYAVLGLARSGLSVVETLLASGARVTAWDNRDEARAQVEGRAELADPLAIDLAGFDGVVVSPGVPLNRHPIAGAARKAGVPVIGDIELFAQARPSLPPHKAVGITGTNGKSTTTSLVHHILKTVGVPTTMGGNIGLPILGQDPLPEGGVYVLELSSYQLDLTYSLDCDVAVLLNITPDHLDRYGSFDAYAASKARLFAMQSDHHWALISDSDEPTLAVLDQVASKRPRDPDGAPLDVPQGVRLLTATEDEAFDAPSLPGPHNRQNIVAAMMVGFCLDLSRKQIDAGLRSFTGLPHRMERVAEHGGVLFVNDSKATNPASTAPALAAYPRIHWILGGLPKGDDLDVCLPHLGNVVAAYTIGEAGPRFAEILAPHVPVTRSEMLCEAVRQAIAAAQPGEVVMLSPACASFDQFRDFEARGDAFRDIVAALTSETEAVR
jgi:UDP-N-acetylmuramoylalanine--D-glutamate ligase